MSKPERYKTFSRTREEYDRLRVKREQTVGRATIYTAMILLENCVSDAWALPAEVKDEPGRMGEVVRLFLKQPNDFSPLVDRPGPLSSGIWTPETQLRFQEEDKNMINTVEVYFLPYDDGLDLSSLDIGGFADVSSNAGDLVGAGH